MQQKRWMTPIDPASADAALYVPPDPPTPENKGPFLLFRIERREKISNQLLCMWARPAVITLFKCNQQGQKRYISIIMMRGKEDQKRWRFFTTLLLYFLVCLLLSSLSLSLALFLCCCMTRAYDVYRFLSWLKIKSDSAPPAVPLIPFSFSISKRERANEILVPAGLLSTLEGTPLT